MQSKKWWATKAIMSSIRTRGVWSGISLTAVLLRSVLRTWFGHHQRTVISILMFGILVAGGWAGMHIFTDLAAIRTPGDIWSAAVLIGLALSAVSIGSAHFLLTPIFQRQVWLRSVYALGFASVVGGLGYLGFERWKLLYAEDPASAVLWGLVVTPVIFGFRDIVFWFMRSVLVHEATAGGLDDLASLTEAGRWKVAIHEAGHAICYGLCAAVPEDAWVGLDLDLNNLVAGSVNIPTPKDPTEVSKSFMEWSMLMTMAGVAAERVFFGDSSMNGRGDNQSVQVQAAAYLVAGHGEIYDMEALTEPQIAANRAAIARVRDHFSVLAESYIQANKEMCESLAKEINKMEFLDCEGIAASVSKAVYPTGWIALAWPASLPVIPLKQ